MDMIYGVIGITYTTHVRAKSCKDGICKNPINGIERIELILKKKKEVINNLSSKTKKIKGKRGRFSAR